MAEFLDETEALQANVEGLNQLSQSLRTFNESFASWLYVMNMNSLATDFPQVGIQVRVGIKVIANRAFRHRMKLPRRWRSYGMVCFILARFSGGR